jgi:prepilin-type N-terminal cleavage/methylation domain-containing protein
MNVDWGQPPASCCGQAPVFYKVEAATPRMAGDTNDKEGHMRRREMRGFSLLEMMAVLGIATIVAAISFVTLQPLQQNNHVVEAYNITMSALRQARDISVAQRQDYYVTFSNAAVPNTITITQGGTGTVIRSYTIPLDVAYQIVLGVPTAAGTTPDGFGLGNLAIDFDWNVAGGNNSVVYFYPDGTGKDVNGYTNNGVIYIAQANKLYSSHAITVWGATGRIRGWRLYNNAGTPYWREM